MALPALSHSPGCVQRLLCSLCVEYPGIFNDVFKLAVVLFHLYFSIVKLVKLPFSFGMLKCLKSILLVLGFKIGVNISNIYFSNYFTLVRCKAV